MVIYVNQFHLQEENTSNSCNPVSLLSFFPGASVYRFFFFQTRSQAAEIARRSYYLILLCSLFLVLWRDVDLLETSSFDTLFGTQVLYQHELDTI